MRSKGKFQDVSNGLAWTKKWIMINSKNSKRQGEFHIERCYPLEKKSGLWIKVGFHCHTWSYMWCKDEELEFGNGFLGTKLGDGQLGCAKEPMLRWQNILWIQLEESWSYIVFMFASVNHSRIILWRKWLELEVDFFQRQRFKVTSSRKMCSK